LVKLDWDRQSGPEQPIRISVTDTGIGIEENKIDVIFEQFSQVDGSTTRNYGGTGLGLAISKRLVRLMKGEIGVSSTPGEGSTFWFSLPLRLDSEALPSSPVEVQMELLHSIATTWAARNVSRGADLYQSHTALKPVTAPFVRPLRVLIAEDNSVNQRVALRMLEKQGLRADVAADGREAVELFEMVPYDLILMDCQMPRMDGYEATGEIRRRERPGRRTRIVAMTAEAIEGARERCLAAGMDEYISKPISFANLTEILNKCQRAEEAHLCTE
jgi:CheY-like chemotaxis protein